MKQIKHTIDTETVRIFRIEEVFFRSSFISIFCVFKFYGAIQKGEKVCLSGKIHC